MQGLVVTQLDEGEINQYIFTGMSRQEAIDEIAYWRNVEGMLSQQQLVAR